MPHPIKLIVAVAMYVFAMTSTASGQTQDLPNAMTWLAPSGTSASNQALDSSGNGAFSGYRRYSMPSSYMPDGMYLPPPRIVWDDTLGYWDNSQVIDAGGYYTDDANSGIWYSEEAYYGAHPDAISPTGEILQSALYYPNWVINPVWVSTPGYRTISDDVPRQYYATESVNVYVALGDSMVAVQRTLTILEKMPSGDDAQVSSTTSLEAAYLDWSTGLFSTGEFYASFPQQQTDPGEGGDSAWQQPPKEEVVEVDIGYNVVRRVPGDYYHSFVILKDLLSSDQFVTGSRPLIIDIQSQFYTEPAILIIINPTSANYTDQEDDNPSRTFDTQKVGVVYAPYEDVKNYATAFGIAVRSQEVPYEPTGYLGYNSNGYTSTFLNYLGFSVSSPNLTHALIGFDSRLPALTSLQPSTWSIVQE